MADEIKVGKLGQKHWVGFPRAERTNSVIKRDEFFCSMHMVFFRLVGVFRIATETGKAKRMIRVRVQVGPVAG